MSRSNPLPRPLGMTLLVASCTLSVLLTCTLSGALRAQTDSSAADNDPLLWPEEQRAFLQDGAALLLPRDQVEALRAITDTAERQAFIDSFLDRDPIPETEVNELREGIRRRAQMIVNAGILPQDERAILLFLHGQPDERKIVDCSTAFKPLEIWGYGADEKQRRYLLLYQRAPDEAYRLWLPLDSKRALYTPELEYFLEQWEELKKRIVGGRRFDYQICPEAKRIDKLTGVDGLFGFEKDRPSNQTFLPFLEPPTDLAAWARRAAAEVLPPAPEELRISDFQLQFPKREGQRMQARLSVLLPEDANIKIATTGEQPELDLSVEGIVEQGGAIFDTFRVRFTLEPPATPAPVALVAERSLRPGHSFLLRLKVKDEVGGAELRLTRGFRVPLEPEAVPELPVPEETIIALGEKLAQQRIPGLDSLVLVPPEDDVILGLWRAEALITGERITKVAFLVDGKTQLTRSRPPFTAEVRLTKYPSEQVVRAEGYDDTDTLVTADEVILNQPRGALRVRIVEPKRGAKVTAPVLARAEIVVPEGRRIQKVQFLLNNDLLTELDHAPWETQVPAPETTELTYLTVVAFLDDDSRAEDVRFLNTPEYLEEVDVNLVELYTTVLDSEGHLAKGLTAEDFDVFEDGKRQTLSKFELVENLPLTIGIVIDTSGSMAPSIGEAQRAATDFLHNIVTRRDRCFALSFSDRPVMLMPPTNDVQAVEQSLQGLLATGSTSLHDAVVTSLYYFRGVTGRRALVLLSDGDDTSSTLAFRDALEYARRSGVSIYTIGLGVGSLDMSVRGKLRDLSSETGGQSFFVNKAEELSAIYRQIEEELRSQYLLAYPSPKASGEGTYRQVEVKVNKRGLKARTARGYYD